MQDFDSVSVDDDNLCDSRAEKLERARVLSRIFFKRFLMMVFFGPGVLGFLWLIGKLLKR